MTKFSPVDFHCHGIGRFDFTEPNSLVLDELEHSLQIEGVYSILTLYLPKSKLSDLEELVAAFDLGRKIGRYRHILGIALEGPVLASFGGTPEMGCWQPTIVEWQRIAALGPAGLIYVVISPDAEIPTAEEYPASVLEIIDILLNFGVKPAFGHFKKTDPQKTASLLALACDHIEKIKKGPAYTDHLFNDMPVKFKYAWRTKAEKLTRDIEIENILATEWTDENMFEVLGPVPATIIKYAKRNVLKVCMNFDGEHVDLSICKKAVALLGSENLMLMTDRIQSEILGGQHLHSVDENSLLYQSGGIVAGGSQAVMRQIGNMLSIGLSANDIFHIVSQTAVTALNINHENKSAPVVHAYTTDAMALEA